MMHLFLKLRVVKQIYFNNFYRVLFIGFCIALYYLIICAKNNPKTLNFGDELILSESKDDKNQDCRAKTNIVFIKNHKCASSSIQNIFFRFGDEHNLSFVLPRDENNYLGHPQPFHRSFVFYPED